MKKINICIILISSSIATAMNPTAWSQHVKNWNETDFMKIKCNCYHYQ